jgi:hypothetical protein
MLDGHGNLFADNVVNVKRRCQIIARIYRYNGKAFKADYRLIRRRPQE